MSQEKNVETPIGDRDPSSDVIDLPRYALDEWLDTAEAGCGIRGSRRSIDHLSVKIR